MLCHKEGASRGTLTNWKAPGATSIAAQPISDVTAGTKGNTVQMWIYLLVDIPQLRNPLALGTRLPEDGLCGVRHRTSAPVFVPGDLQVLGGASGTCLGEEIPRLRIEPGIWSKSSGESLEQCNSGSNA